MVHLHLDTVTDSRTTLYKSCLVNLADDSINLCDDLGSVCNHQCNNNRFLLDLLVVLSEKLQAIIGEVLQTQLLTNDGEVLGRY